MNDNAPSTASRNRAVIRKQLGRYDWLLEASCQNTAWLERLGHPGQLLMPPARPLKNARPGREVVRTKLPDEHPAEVVVKRFIPRTLTEIIKFVWRDSPAWRAFKLAHQMAQLGLVTPAPKAAGEFRRYGLLKECYLVTAAMQDAVPLSQFNARCADLARRTNVVRQLARIYAILHDSGFYHSDPSQTNFMILSHPNDCDEVVLIDLDGLRHGGDMNIGKSARDLQRLLLRGFIPRRERAWFIAVYTHSRNVLMDARELLRIIGPIPARSTNPVCALDENRRPAITG
jgi:tRNA A-37 threonylcarbamoyl transferase component Bud32